MADSEKAAAKTRNIKLILSYDGTGLSGWQRQANAASVQEHLEVAVTSMVGVPTAVTGASRTDAGVHALGQVAHFRTTTNIPCHGFRRGLNGRLPAQIAIVACSEAAADFHARFGSRGKHYRYTVLISRERLPLWRHRAWHCSTELDFAAMEEAAALMLGERDFSAFRAAECTAKTATRYVSAVDFTTEPVLGNPEAVFLHIDVRGNAFLRKMVRIMVGTLVDVGLGRIASAAVADIIDSGDRTRAGRTAPPQGLTLVTVFY